MSHPEQLVELGMKTEDGNDPTTLVTACVVLAVSAVVAGLLPARRAANLDPMRALREE